MVTIKDVAKKAEVSVSTVSNVLNNRKNVSEATRKRIFEICEELNYIPNVAGKTLKSGKNKTVLFCFSDFDRNFYLEILKGIHECIEKSDYDLIVSTSNVAKKYMQNNFTCGAIVLDYRLDSDFISKINTKSYPIVFLDRVNEDEYSKSVVVNNYCGMTELVENLVSSGRRKFAFMGGVHTSDNAERYKAFLDVLKKHNILYNEELYFDGDFKKSSGYNGARYLLEKTSDIDCIVCVNDDMAVGGLQYLQDCDIDVPREIAVTGFDYSEVGKVFNISTVKISNYQRGYIACEALIKTIEGDNVAKIIELGTKFHKGKTCGVE